MDNKLMRKILFMVSLSLFITFITIFIMNAIPSVQHLVFMNDCYCALILFECVAIFFIAPLVLKFNPFFARLFFLIHAIYTGVMYGSMAIFFSLSSIMYIFLAASILFLSIALLGYLKKVNLYKFRIYWMMGFLATAILTIINIRIDADSEILYSCIVAMFLYTSFIVCDIKRVINLERTLIPDNKKHLNGSLGITVNFFYNFMRAIVNLQNETF